MAGSVDNTDSRTDQEFVRADDRESRDFPVSRCQSIGSGSDSDARPPSLRRRSYRSWLLAALVAGTLIRILTVLLSSPEYNLPFWTTYSWPMDHVTYVSWAEQATSPEQGLLTMYTRPQGKGLTVRMPAGRDFVRVEKLGIANYPPLGLYLIWLQGEIHRFLDPQMIANTALARAIYQAIPLIGDMVLAIGVWMLCLHVFERRTAVIATTVVYLIPPIWLNSCWWGQTDSWEMAPMVWIVWAMARRRWLTAGMLWGIGLSLKPQVILFAPVWLFVGLNVLAKRNTSTGTERAKGDFVRIIVAILAAVVLLNLTALPFWLTSGSAWFDQSYLRNLRDEQPFTTLKAFNIWYLDLLCTYDADAVRSLAGVARDTWGKILTLAGMCLAALITLRHEESRAHRVVLFAGLWLLVVVMFPTRVHERYIVMCLPFLVMAAAACRRFWPGVIALVVVACFQMTVYQWLTEPADAWTRKLLAETVNYHRAAMAQTPLDLRHQLPTLDQAIQMRFDIFLDGHTSFALLEWSLSILACFATGQVFYAAWKLRARPENDRCAA